MKRVILGLGLLAGFVVLQVNDAKAEPWDRIDHNHGRSSLPAYRRELLHARSHQMPLNSVNTHRHNDFSPYGSNQLYRNSYPGMSGNGYYGTPLNRVYSSPSIGCDTDWNYNSGLRSRSIYEGNHYSW